MKTWSFISLLFLPLFLTALSPDTLTRQLQSEDEIRSTLIRSMNGILPSEHFNFIVALQTTETKREAVKESVRSEEPENSAAHKPPKVHLPGFEKTKKIIKDPPKATELKTRYEYEQVVTGISVILLVDSEIKSEQKELASAIIRSKLKSISNVPVELTIKDGNFQRPPQETKTDNKSSWQLEPKEIIMLAALLFIALMLIFFTQSQERSISTSKT